MFAKMTANSGEARLGGGNRNVPTPSNPSVVHIVDDEAGVRASLAELLQSVGMTAKTYSSAEEFLDAYDPTVPGCLLVDMCMPGMSGLELQRTLAEREQSMPWVVLTAHADVATAVHAMSMGASGFLEKPYRAHELLDAIREAIERDRKQRRQQTYARELLSRFERLSPREHEVMELVTAGVMSKQIASRLGISQRTVEVHRARIMEKLEVHTLVELARIAIEFRAIRDSRMPNT